MSTDSTQPDAPPKNGDGPRHDWSPDPLAWLSSLCLHALALIGLATATLLAPVDRVPSLLVDVPPEEPPPLLDAFRVSDEVLLDPGALSDGGAGDALAAAPVEELVSEASLDLVSLTEVGDLPTLELDSEQLTSPDPEQSMLVRGVGAVGVSGSSGAVDRLTGEILQSLDQSPTLVVWLFDRSASLREQREQIADRFDRVYDELGAIQNKGAEEFKHHEEVPLLTAVASFGTTIDFAIDEPTDEVKKAKSAVRAISEDPGGEENVFNAILEVVERYKRYRLKRPRRNVLLVVVTDESGDDLHRLDQCVSVCRKFQTPVYVVGAPAPFGRKEAYVRYVDPDPAFDQTPQWLPVRQGPESLMPERLKLGAIGGRDFNGPMLDSGFGPFALTRLAAETGGFFISVHPFRVDAGRANRRGADPNLLAANLDYFFDQRLMRRYRPDYVPVAEYQNRLRDNRARSALVEAASKSWTEPLGNNIRREFPALDEADFSEALSRAQRSAAVLEPKLAQLVETLRRGEKDRPKLDSPRWEAGFDLALGRALAAKVRTEGYNAMLAQAKQGLEFKNERNDTWVIAPDDEVTSGSQLAAEAEQASAYLNRVVEEHEGTPWALLAQRELDQPLGWKWREAFRNLQERQERQNNNPRPRNRPEPEMKPRRPPPKL